MVRDSKFLRRNPKCLDSDEIENVPENSGDSLGSQTCTDVTRPPLNTIQEHIPTKAVSKQDHGVKVLKVDRTPTKMKRKTSDPLQTHENPYLSMKNRFGCQKSESSEACEEDRIDSANCDSQLIRGTGTGASLAPMTTPRSTKTTGRATSGYSECSSTKCTPTKIVSKPPNPALVNAHRPPVNGGSRAGSYAALSKGIPVSCVPSTIVNTVEVPHFDLNEDPSFWMDHNAQVLIRVRPLNNMEKSSGGYSRCLKQESAQSITWVGQPETRFTFDHVACESIDQETLFKMAGRPMVENCLSGYNSCMFAFGQTGSGKTHTMLGEIEELQVKLSPNRGMTPRIFEFLFARIQAEEESRRDEKLKYKCKCSFLEIYNEQITDLLDPSRTNLSIREDIKKGVYVENLSEFEVQSVGDILTLLSQGSSNRRIAATHMNRESSRSHSVFTCVIESRWEKDAICNLRFARLNLVDLAGSERQKSSGAEGERLKEAANINKSLSTLGHVIMILVDVANGKPRHIPYRDSKLTFLLQDSLGGNSKTMIIANVSPSMGCVAETLNTLKFAQRAKLIQNNAIVNEDSSEDIIALQHQIRHLKEELSSLRRQHVSRSISFGLGDRLKYLENSCEDKEIQMEEKHCDTSLSESKDILRFYSSNQVKSLETTLAGALKREQMADTTIKQLEDEIEQLNLLVHQKEDDTRCTKMMLKFREEKIQRLESLVGGLITPDTYLLQENISLSKEIQLLKANLDRDPQNIRILEQSRRYRVQDLYEEGEREALLSEVSQLGEQLNKALKNLEDCRNNLSSSLENNALLRNEVNVLHASLNGLESPDDCCTEVTKELKIEATGVGNDNGMMRHETCVHHIEELVDKQLEIDILKIIVTEERSSHVEMEEKERLFCRDLELVNGNLLLMTKQYEDIKAELKEATTVIEALESKQLLSIHEIDDLRSRNNQYSLLLKEKELEISSMKEQISCNNVRDPEAKLKKMQESLEKAKMMNIWYQKARSLQACNEKEMDEVCRQAEGETAEVIVYLQDEVNILQEQVHLSNEKDIESKDKLMHLQADLEELQEKSFLMSKELQQKDEELRVFSKNWELFIKEIETNLVEGNMVLDDASHQFDFTSSSLIQRRSWISEQVIHIQNMVAERDLLIEELNGCLYDANEKRSEIESMMMSLRGAVLVITEQECIENEKEIMFLKSELSSKVSRITVLENQLMQKEEQLQKASTCATVAFVVVNRLSEVNSLYLEELTSKEGSLHNQAVEARDLRLQLSVEKEHTCIMEQKLEETKKYDILKMGEKVSKVLNGVSELRSCLDITKKKAEDQEDDIISESQVS